MKSNWQSAGVGAVTGVSWPDWLDGRRRVDPYLVWADLTSFAGLGGLYPGEKLPVLVESARPPSSEETDAPLLLAEMEVPGVYKASSTDTPSWRFYTARIAPGSVQTLLTSSGAVRRFQLGLPRIPFTDESPSITLPPLNVADRVYPEVIVGVIDDGCAFPHPQFVQDRDPGEFSVLTAHSSRVRYLWDQGARVGPRTSAQGDSDAVTPTQPPSLGYGGEWDYKAIDRLMARPSSQGLSQRNLYEAAGYQRMRWEPSLHGTGVMDLACGKQPPLDPVKATLQMGSGKSPDAPPDPQASLDKASQAPAVFVQLPVRTVLDTSGGSLGVHLLDATMYILGKATGLYVRTAGAVGHASEHITASAASHRPATALPPMTASVHRAGALPRVVITASFGSVAGPHDGTSMIEMALADLVQVWPGLAVVVAAGNAHGSRTHAALGLEAAKDVEPQPANVVKGQRALSALPPGTYREVDWEIAPENPHESYLEVWIEDHTANGILVSLLPPMGGPPVQVQVGDAQLLFAQDGQDDAAVPMAGVIYARRVAQGLHGTMVLLAVGPTMPAERMPVPTELDGGDASDTEPRKPVPRPPAPAGTWRVSVQNNLSQRVSVHLWTERSDLVGRRRRRQQSRLQDVGPASVQSDHSFGTLANGSPLPGRGQVWVVGGYRLSDGKMAPYSSGGPALAPSTRRGPDVEAPSDMAISMPGIRVAGPRWGSSSRLGGTSAAAPLLARWIANHWTGTDPASYSPAALAALIDRGLRPVTPDRLEDTPPWPEPMPEGHDDPLRRGRRRL